MEMLIQILSVVYVTLRMLIWEQDLFWFNSIDVYSPLRINYHVCVNTEIQSQISWTL